MSIVEATLLAFLYSLDYYSTFIPSDTGNTCPIIFSTNICDPEGRHGCNWHGHVEYREYDIPTIVINLNHWNEISDVHRKELVFHELGHCSHGLTHRWTENIMRPRTYSTKPDGSNWEELVDRMQEQINLEYSLE